MKNLLLLPFILLSHFGYAQYALPSTHVYGSLDVDSYIHNNYNGFTLLNDTFAAGMVASIPMAGANIRTPNGLWVSSLGDWSLFGGEAIEANLGHFELGVNNYISFGSVDAEVRVADDLNITVADNWTSRTNHFQLTGEDTIGLYMTQGDTITNLIMMGKNGGANQLMKFEGSIGKGYSGFETQVESGMLSAKMYVTSTLIATNLSVLAMDSTKVQISTNAFAEETEFNSNGIVIPRLTLEPTGENGAMYYNTTSNLFRVYENGAWRNM